MTTERSQSEKLRKAAKSYFKSYPDIQYILVTADGLFFTPENEEDAGNHARRVQKELLRFERNPGKNKTRKAPAGKKVKSK